MAGQHDGTCPRECRDYWDDEFLADQWTNGPVTPQEAEWVAQLAEDSQDHPDPR